MVGILKKLTRHWLNPGSILSSGKEEVRPGPVQPEGHACTWGAPGLAAIPGAAVQKALNTATLYPGQRWGAVLNRPCRQHSAGQAQSTLNCNMAPLESA